MSNSNNGRQENTKQVWGRERRKGGHQYAFDQPINGNDVGNFLNQRKANGKTGKIYLLTGIHGDKNQYNKHRVQLPDKPGTTREQTKIVEKMFIPTKDSIDPISYKADADAIEKNGHNNATCLDMADRNHRKQFVEDVVNTSNVSIIHGQCYGKDNQFFRNSDLCDTDYSPKTPEVLSWSSNQTPQNDPAQSLLSDNINEQPQNDNSNDPFLNHISEALKTPNQSQCSEIRSKQSPLHQPRSLPENSEAGKGSASKMPNDRRYNDEVKELEQKYQDMVKEHQKAMEEIKRKQKIQQYQQAIQQFDGKKIGSLMNTIINKSGYDQDKALGDLCITLATSAAKSLSIFVPELGVAIAGLELVCDIVSGLLGNNDDAKESEDDHLLSLFARAFSSDHFAKSSGQLKHLLRKMDSLADLLNDSSTEVTKDYDRTIIAKLTKYGFSKSSIMEAMDNVLNRKDINEIMDYVQSNTNNIQPSIVDDEGPFIKQINKVYKQYEQIQIPIAGSFESITKNIYNAREITNPEDLMRIHDEIYQFIQALQFRNIVYGMVAMIVGNDISKLDKVDESQKEIQEYILSTTQDYIQKLSFLARPKVSNRVFVSSFYNYHGDRVNYIINSIESMSNIKFPRPEDDFGDNGSIFYLYPMEWMPKQKCYVSRKFGGELATIKDLVSGIVRLGIGALVDELRLCYSNKKTDNTKLKLKRLSDINDESEYKYRIYFDNLENSYWAQAIRQNGPKMIADKGSNPKEPHDLIIFKVFDNNDEFYLISKSGHPSWFAYQSSDVWQGRGLWFGDGYPTAKAYWKWET